MPDSFNVSDLFDSLPLSEQVDPKKIKIKEGSITYKNWTLKTKLRSPSPEGEAQEEGSGQEDDDQAETVTTLAQQQEDSGDESDDEAESDDAVYAAHEPEAVEHDEQDRLGSSPHEQLDALINSIAGLCHSDPPIGAARATTPTEDKDGLEPNMDQQHILEDHIADLCFYDPPQSGPTVAVAPADNRLSQHDLQPSNPGSEVELLTDYEESDTSSIPQAVSPAEHSKPHEECVILAPSPRRPFGTPSFASIVPLPNEIPLLSLSEHYIEDAPCQTSSILDTPHMRPIELPIAQATLFEEDPAERFRATADLEVLAKVDQLITYVKALQDEDSRAPRRPSLSERRKVSSRRLCSRHPELSLHPRIQFFLQLAHSAHNSRAIPLCWPRRTARVLNLEQARMRRHCRHPHLVPPVGVAFMRKAVARFGSYWRPRPPSSFDSRADECKPVGVVVVHTDTAEEPLPLISTQNLQSITPPTPIALPTLPTDQSRALAQDIPAKKGRVTSPMDCTPDAVGVSNPGPPFILLPAPTANLPSPWSVMPAAQLPPPLQVPPPVGKASPGSDSVPMQVSPPPTVPLFTPLPNPFISVTDRRRAPQSNGPDVAEIHMKSPSPPSFSKHVHTRPSPGQIPVPMQISPPPQFPLSIQPSRLTVSAPQFHPPLPPSDLEVEVHMKSPPPPFAPERVPSTREPSPMYIEQSHGPSATHEDEPMREPSPPAQADGAWSEDTLQQATNWEDEPLWEPEGGWFGDVELPILVEDAVVPVCSKSLDVLDLGVDPAMNIPSTPRELPAEGSTMLGGLVDLIFESTSPPKSALYFTLDDLDWNVLRTYAQLEHTERPLGVDAAVLLMLRVLRAAAFLTPRAPARELTADSTCWSSVSASTALSSPSPVTPDSPYLWYDPAADDGSPLSYVPRASKPEVDGVLGSPSLTHSTLGGAPRTIDLDALVLPVFG